MPSLLSTLGPRSPSITFLSQSRLTLWLVSDLRSRSYTCIALHVFRISLNCLEAVNLPPMVEIGTPSKSG